MREVLFGAAPPAEAHAAAPLAEAHAAAAPLAVAPPPAEHAVDYGCYERRRELVLNEFRKHNAPQDRVDAFLEDCKQKATGLVLITCQNIRVVASKGVLYRVSLAGQGVVACPHVRFIVLVSLQYCTRSIYSYL